MQTKIYLKSKSGLNFLVHVYCVVSGIGGKTVYLPGIKTGFASYCKKQ